MNYTRQGITSLLPQPVHYNIITIIRHYNVQNIDITTYRREHATSRTETMYRNGGGGVEGKPQ